MSFGSSGFGSSGFGANNNTNNQQPGGLFGGGGFGTNTSNTAPGFGASPNNAFGGNNTTGNSLFGGNNNNNNNTTPNSGFGGNTSGFGTNTNNTTSTSLFGGGGTNSSRPAFGAGGNSSGGGLFGNAGSTGGGFGGGGGFGPSTTNTGGFGGNTGGGLFGNANNATNNNTTSGFGAPTNTGGGGLFGGGGGGGGSTSTGFGANNSSFGAGGFGANQATGQNPGTGQVTSFNPFTEKEGTTTATFQSVGFQPPYVNWSFEELRTQDYDQGRKHGNQNGQGGAFGTSSGFGGASTANNTLGGSGGFGSGGGFGTNQNTTSGFGAQQNTGFGTNQSGGGLFGQQNNKPSLFGNATTTSSQTGGGLFGTANNNTSSTGTTGGSLFGGTNTGTFGTQNKTGFGGTSAFGNASSSSNPFGSGGGGGGGGGFGTQPQQNNTQNQSTGFGGFGTNPNSNTNSNTGKSLFGNTGTTGGSSLFGNASQNQQQNTNPFGQASTQNNTSSSLFGAKPAGNSLFGGQPNTQQNTGSSLFGNTQNQGQQQSSGGLFGQPKPGGLFGNTNNNNNNNNNNTGFGGSTFGSSLNQNNTTQPAAGGGLFGNTQNQSQLGGSLFGNSQQQQQPQQPQQPQQLSASMMNAYPYGHEQLFADLGTPEKPVGPVATPLSSSQNARRPAPLPAWKLNPNASMRLITPQKRPGVGYGFSYSAYGTPSSAYSTPSYSNSLLGGGTQRTLNKSISVGNMRNADDGLFRPDAFSPSLRPSTGRGSMKRLHIDRSLRTSFLEDDFNNPNRSPLRKTVSFNSDATPEANRQASTALVRRQNSEMEEDEQNGYLRASTRGATTDGDSATPGTEQVNGNAPQLQQPSSSAGADPAPANGEFARELKEARARQDDQPAGDYWSIPGISELKQMSRDELRSVKNLTVGRHGLGKIIFDDVNLQRVPLDNILGKIVDFKMRQATVYPETATKPPPGKDLNVPATVYLENSWPRSQRGKSKVFAKSGPQIDRHLAKLKSVAATEFQNYNTDTGTWQFRVSHFSSYQLDYDDTNELSSSMLSAPPESLGSLRHSTLNQDQTPADFNADVSIFTNGDVSRNSDMDDTFAFRKSRKSMPGGFDGFDAQFASGLEDAETMNSVDESLTQTPEPRRASSSAFEMQVDQPDEVPMAGDFPPNVDGPSDDRPFPRSPTRQASILPRSITKTTRQARQLNMSHHRNLIDVDEDSWAGQLQRTLSPKKQDRQLLRETQKVVLQARQPGLASPAKVPSKDAPFKTHFELMNSLFGKGPAEETQRGTKQAAGGKGFKLPYPKRPRTSQQVQNMEARHNSPAIYNTSWTQDGSLLVSVTLRRARSVKSSHAELEPLQIFPTPQQSSTFDYYLSLAQSSIDNSGVPTTAVPSTFSFAEFASTLSTDANTSTNAEKEVWDLLQILFDSQDPDQDADVASAHRKTLFSQFWKSIVTPDALVHVQHAQDAEEKALAHLSANDIWSATETLLAGGNPKLAAMISQIDAADQDFKAAVREQIDHWQDANIISEIPQRIRALYELLAGNACTAEGKLGAGPENKAENFNISSRFRLNWRRSFGLRLWYATIREDTVEYAIDLYRAELGRYEEQVRPLPKFIEDKTDTGWSDPQPDSRTDVLWSLLKLYAAGKSVSGMLDLKETADLFALENVVGNPLDARMSFMLHQTLQARGLILPEITELPDEEEDDTSDHPSNLSDTITSTFLAQLSQKSEDLVRAVFVALHLTHTASRRTAVNSLLTRHAAALGSSPDVCVTWRAVMDLKIPESWVWTAKATYAHTVLHDDKARCLFLLRAAEVVEACEVLRSTVAPGAVVAEELLPSINQVIHSAVPADLKTILQEFEDNDEATALTEWKDNLGGSVYVSYTMLIEKVERHRKSGRIHWTGVEGREVKGLLASLKRQLPGTQQMEKLGLNERVAAWEMGSVAEMVAGGLRGQEDGMDVDNARDGGNGSGGVENGVEKASENYYWKIGYA